MRYGASIGAGANILPDVTVGRFAMVGAGAVVAKSVHEHALALGVPARVVGYVCRRGRRPELVEGGGWCAHCDQSFPLAAAHR